MARKPRIEFEGGFYHVIARGNQKQTIFLNENDFRRYLEFLGDYKNRYKFFLYSYVLMPNHVHLLVETGEIPLSKILQGMNQRYTMYFNRRYGTVGHLFQGRYKAILCDKDEYLLNLVRYIHYNPLRARIARSLDEYRWSSHREFLGLNREYLVDTHLVLGIFSDNMGKAKRLYQRYMAEEVKVSREEFYKTVDQRILGGEGFVEQVIERVSKEIAPGKKRHEFSLVEIAGGIRKVWAVSLKDLRAKGKDPHVMEGRKLLSLAGREYGYKGKEIAEFLHKDPAAVTRYTRDKSGFKKKLDRLFSALREIRENINNQV